MTLRRVATLAALLGLGLAAQAGAGERSRVVRESTTIESRGRTYPVAVYRPDDDRTHPALVYLHGGGMSFADPVMARFLAELAGRGLVVLAPHYLLDRTGWTRWQQAAEDTVTLATRLRGVDPDRIGMAGLSMGGQIGLSTAARDPRIKAVAEFFTAWPGSLPDEPIAKLPPVLLLNGTADPVIPFEAAMVLDAILDEHKLPFERHVYEGLGHGFTTPAAFRDGVNRTAAFFGGAVDAPAPKARPVGPQGETVESAGATDDDEADEGLEDGGIVVLDRPAGTSPAPLALKRPKERARAPKKRAPGRVVAGPAAP